MSSEKVKLLESLQSICLTYLCNSGSLKGLFLALEEKRKDGTPFIALDLWITVNFGEMIQLAHELGELLIESPLECQALFQDVLFSICKNWLSADNYRNIEWMPFYAQIPNLSLVSSQENPFSNAITWMGDEDLIGDTQIGKPLSTPQPSMDQNCSTDHCVPIENECFSEWNHPFYSDEKCIELPSEEKSNKAVCSLITPNFEIVDESFLREMVERNVQPQENSIDISSKSQIYVRLCVEGLPCVAPFHVTGLHDLQNLRHPRTGIISGIVMGFSLPQRYTIWSHFVCSSSCEESLKEIYLWTWSPVYKENKKICRFCLSPWIEKTSSRKEGEETTVILLPDSPLNENMNSSPIHGTIKRTVTLNVKDCEKGVIKLGSKIEATVFLVPNVDYHLHPSIHVSNVYPSVPPRMSSQIPHLFKQLLADRNSSPWSMVLTLAYMFCSDISPPGTFLRLKMALLLSLASCSTEESVLAILAVGKRDLLHKRLLRAASQVAPRSIFHSSLDELEGKSFRTSEGETWIEAGSLLRAKGGVCIVEDLAVVKKETKSIICNVLENEQVRVEIPTDLKRTFHTSSHPLRTCIWSTYNPSHTKRPPKDDALFLHAPTGNLTSSVTDVFGLVIYSDTWSREQENEAEEYLCAETLLKTFDEPRKSPPILPTQELIQYLDLVRATNVTFSKDAERLLQGYYVAIRRMRGSSEQRVTIPVTAISTLTKVSKCHAKLSLKTTVEVGDAAAAILLCEEALVAKTGFSALGIQSTPHLSPYQDLHFLLGRKNDEKIERFIEQLQCLISTHTSDIK